MMARTGNWSCLIILFKRRGGECMTNSVLSYNMLLEKGEEPDYIIFKFSSFNPSFLVMDKYCVSPACSCADAVLTFIELSEDGKPLSDWFMIKIDVTTWEVTEKKAFNKMIKVDKLVKEFMKSIENHKEKILSHFIKAKGYGAKNYLDFMSEDIVKLILNGDMVCYSEIFGSKDAETFSFSFDDTDKYFIYDQYCSNPKCLCNEAVLEFYKEDTSKTIQEPEFVIRMKLNSVKYETESSKCSADRIANIIKYLQQNKPEIFSLIKNRYSQLKSASREIIKKYGTEIQEKPSKVKVGRNDPCPCGSGKKSKNCCGS